MSYSELTKTNEIYTVYLVEEDEEELKNYETLNIEHSPECGNAEERHILMEMGRGNGDIGAKNLQHSDRIEGGVVALDDLDNATCTLTFDNPVSLGVVLEKVLVGMVAFRKSGRTIGPENADLGISVRELCQELLGMNDKVEERI